MTWERFSCAARIVKGMLMRLLSKCGWFAGLGVATLFAALLVLVGPAWGAFPGGDGLLAVQPSKGSGIVLVQANGRGVRRVCAGAADARRVCSLARPQWSPDGRTLVTEESNPGYTTLAVMYPDGSCLNCGFGAGGVDPAFTSDPTLLTTVSPPPLSGNSGLFEYGIDGLVRNPQALVPGAMSDPVWSSRGELAVVRGGWIWVGSPGSLRRLTRGRAPSWSPDGGRIVLDRRGWVMIARLRGRLVRRLVRGSAPAWSPDGRWIAFFDKRHRLSVVRPSGRGCAASGI